MLTARNTLARIWPGVVGSTAMLLVRLTWPAAAPAEEMPEAAAVSAAAADSPLATAACAAVSERSPAAAISSGADALPAEDSPGAADAAIAAEVRGAAEPPAAADATAAAPAEPNLLEAALGTLPVVPESVRQLLHDRKYAEAVAAIDQMLAGPEVPAALPRDFLGYLKGRALHLAGEYDEAVAAFEVVEREFAASRWARSAKFARAVALARKGDFQGAERIYREEAQYLLSGQRKQEIAEIYLEFARAYFRPKDEQQPPDYTKALEFFNEALAVGPEPGVRAEVELLVAECYQNLGNLQEAAARYAAFSREHADSPLDIEARFRLGQCQLGMGQPAEARRTWQDLLATYPNNPSERLAEAAFNLAATYGLPTPATREDLSLGVAALEAFLRRFATHRLASRAHLLIAQSQAHLGRYEEAVASLNRFLADERYSGSEEVPLARQLLGRSYQLQKRFAEALAAWQEFLKLHASHAAWAEVQREIINTEYLQGAEAAAGGDAATARQLWGEFLAKYPLDERNPGILYELGRMLHAEQKWEEAVAEWRRLVSKYPQTEAASQAQYMIAWTLEGPLARYEEAIKEYRKLNWGSYVGAAAQRIAALTAPRFEISTERVFRTDETPRLRLVSRNISSLTVRAYRVDLETYFRKMHLAGGVEGLDIALIDPDEEFEFTVPDYQPYREFAGEIEVPLPAQGDVAAAAGVMAVTVSSSTHEATTLVLRSDLEIIVKCSRDEVFVFAENLRTGEPWPNVRLLFSNGSQVFAEAATGQDGVFQQAYEALRDTPADIRVFAVAQGNVASNLADLSGVSVAQGLSERGYIYTDRPVYRAGQLVHVRGILRTVAEDHFVVPEGARYRLEVFDPRNRLVREQEVALNRFGSFHAHFELPAASASGTYRIQVRDEVGRSFQGLFEVQEYQLEPVQIQIDSPRSVYYRGEEIEGTISVRYSYGAPLADREVRYSVGDGRVYTARTDSEGKVPFKLPTREYAESQTLMLLVELPERGLQAGKQFLLATRGFSLAVSTRRDVFVAGETFEVQVSASDAEGKPLAEKLRLRVFERTHVAGQTGERELQVHEVTTGESGTGLVTLRFEQGGTLVLRAEGTDHFGNLISGETVVTVSDDKDRVRLRILADRHTFKVGETARVQLHWREEPALALVTWQGARILGYRLVRLREGANELQFPLTPDLAPNFELAVAVMTNDLPPKEPEARAAFSRFHQASSPFSVERELRVKIEPRRKGQQAGPPRPDEEIEVVITTTDPQGQPVSAELSLAMIDAALAERYAEPLPPIHEVFRGTPRQPAMQTVSSASFSYHPATRAIDRQLLAEAERAAIAADEAEALERLAANAMPGAISPLGPPHGAPVRDAEHFGGVGGAEAGDWAEPRAQTVIANGYGLDDLRQQKAEAAKLGLLASDTATGQQRALARFWKVPDASTFMQRAAAGHNLAVLHQDGRQENLDVRGKSAAELTALAAELRAAGARVLAPHATQETGYWHPEVVTDESGQAVVALTLPPRSTGWRLRARGITVDTLAGEAAAELQVRKALFGELKLPLAFTAGDEAEVEVLIHNDIVDQGTIKATLRATIGGRSVQEDRELPVNARGVHETRFKLALGWPEGVPPQAAQEIELELRVAHGEETDVTSRAVPLLPYGMPVFATASGVASADATVFLAPPDMPLESPSLEIFVGPTVERSLLDVLFGPIPWCQAEHARLASAIDTATSDLMAAVALQALLADTTADDPQVRALDERVRAGIALLGSAQRDDGGWSWSGSGGTTDRYTTARAFWALTLARKAGYTVADGTYDSAAQYLAGQVAASAESDFDSKSVLLHALASAGRGDFALANRLHRNRPSLSNAALAYLAAALVYMERPQMAGEILELLLARNLKAAPAETEQPGLASWTHAQVEVMAIALLAQQEVAPQHARTRELVESLLAARVGPRWSPDKATGPATLALARWFGRNRQAHEQYRLTVFVNDRQAAVLDVGPKSPTHTIQVPAELLKEGPQRILFALEGRGRFAYQCVLSGFVPADKLASHKANWQVRRTYEPAPRELDGREIPRGFDIVQGNYTHFRNPLTQLPVGQRGHVVLELWRTVHAATPDEQLDYLVLTEPLPAGVSVIESSIAGGFERYEIQPGAIIFYIGSRRYVDTIQFDVHGYMPGTYRAAPTFVRNAYRPEQLAVAEARALTVLPQGAASGDEYRLTPRELFELGRRYFERRQYDAAGRYLSELTVNWQLQPDPHREAVQMLLDVYLQLGPARSVVEQFELLREKWPSVEIPFDKIVKIGAAYDEIGEYERSYLVFRATIEGSFLRETAVPGFLQNRGEFLRSVGVMRRLLAEYPPEPYAAAAQYALAQNVYAYAPQASADPKLREQKIGRVELVRLALGMLEEFLTVYPEDPAADQASFSLANALLELKAYRQAIERAQQFAARYPNSEYLDSFWFVIGYSHFALGEAEAALEMCRQVADTLRVDPRTGRETETRNKWQAVYMLGQIYHSLGQAVQAIAEYGRVADRFDDARKAIEYFTRKDLALPEVTTVLPGQPAEVELRFRNVARCDAMVYRIDLLKFGLLKRNLEHVTQINLAGIRPYHEAQIELGDGEDYRDRTLALQLPLREEGAYLVVCRGDNLHASGLVLVTPLAIEVQEEASSGEVRATIKDALAGRYVPNVQVKVIGSANDEFVSGETDLRGVFAAQSIIGTSTVIARAQGDRYAFYRGRLYLGPQPQAAQQQQQEPPMPQEEKADLLKNLNESNTLIQTQQQEQLKQIYNKRKSGVEVQEAF